MSTDVYQEVTDRIISALEQGTVPWRQPWIASADPHRNPVSKTEYRGINPFLLEMTARAEGYNDPRWITFKQARTLGGAVRKGERSTLVIFWKILRSKDEATGKDRAIPLLRYYRVFNVAQCDDIRLAPLPEPEPFDSIERAEYIIDGMPNAPTIYYRGNEASYLPPLDIVTMPRREQFKSPDGFYHTMFHELAHSTGHSSRLAREEIVGKEDPDSYAREELTAELAAAMLCGVCALDVPERIDQSAAYIASWLRSLRDDPKMVVSAAGRAQQAADCIRGITREVKSDDKATPELVAA